MRVNGIGEFDDRGAYWRLVYDRCGHVQRITRELLDDEERAAWHIQRYYAECLLCRLPRQPRRLGGPSTEVAESGDSEMGGPRTVDPSRLAFHADEMPLTMTYPGALERFGRVLSQLAHDLARIASELEGGQ